MKSALRAWRTGLLAIALLAAPVAAGNVHKVDPTDATAFKTIGDAIAAAAPGDVIVVYPKPPIPGIYFTGLYPPFTVDKSLSIVAEAGVLVRSKTATVKDLAPGDRVVLRGIQFERAMPALGAVNLRLENNRGLVWLEECVFRISTEIFQPLISLPPVPADPAVEILGPMDGLPGAATFVRCEINGTDGATDLTPGASYGFQMQAGVGLHVERTYVALWDCTVRGGKGQPGSIAYGLDGGDGADAATVDAGYVFASNSTLSGGAGGYGIPSGTLPCVGGGDGGHGIAVAGATVEMLACTRTGGAAGAPGGACAGGGTGLAESPAGAVTDVPGAAFTLAADAPKREDEDLHLELGGPPQGLFLVDLAFDPVFQLAPYGPLVKGPLHVTASPILPLHPAFLGQLGPAGGAAIGLPLAGALGGQQGEVFFFQAVGLAPAAAAFTASSPSAFVLLAPGL